MSTITIRPSFIIFRDEPSSEPSAAAVKAATAPSTTSTTVLTIVTARDKENLHPVSGRRSNTEEGTVKKNKTSALSIKILKPARKAVDSGLAPKKRKLAVASDKNAVGGKEKEPKKDKRATNVPRKPKAKPSNRARKAPELPKVEEEDPTEEEVSVKSNTQTEAETPQAVVDSKCYELTVLPLADVSKAFEESSPAADKPSSAVAETKVSQAESDDEDCITNIWSTQPTSKLPAICKLSLTETPTKPKIGLFSTPERKRIYSAFTFESPSPAASRYAISRGSSVDRFSDLAFDPISDAISIHAH